MVSKLSSALAAPVLEAAQLNEVIAFVAVARSGSFSAAARRLARDASTISRRITELELRLGVRLIVRTTRQLALTEAGTSYLARSGAALDEIAHADADVSSFGANPQGLLRVALPRTYGRMWVAPLLPRFMQRYPEVRIDVRFSDAFTDLVGEGFDVAVRLGALRDSSLVARKVGDVERRLYAAPAYLTRIFHRTPVEARTALPFE
ncbi:MAG: LysR substrate-binding domain-containing protein, partial [Burkholderiales bacterium]